MFDILREAVLIITALSAVFVIEYCLDKIGETNGKNNK